MEAKKKNVSLRMSQSDIEKVKQIAGRLDVKESEVLRFAVKQMLTRLALFNEQSYKGVDLMPALLDTGEDLIRFFDLDAEQLNQIINSDLKEDGRAVDPEDLKLFALSSINERYARMKLNFEFHQNIQDVSDFKAYFMQKYFSHEASDEGNTKWNPFSGKPESSFSMPKIA
tara:strand:- start:1414 stop:1926 length:513 start_codon:yes stop_codon:yes gene_type:complete